MKISGKNTIGFQLSQQGNQTFKSFDPARNVENETVFYEATPAEVEEAMRLAAAACEPFAQLSGKKRGDFLRRIARLMDQHRDVLLEEYMRESGLRIARGEVGLKRTLYHLNAYAEMISADSWGLVNDDPAEPNRQPIPKPSLTKMYFPIGTVVVFGASNFPFAYSTVGGDTVAAFAAGCPVVVKSHPMHAGTGDLVAQLVVQAAQETRMPEGVFAHLQVRNFEVGQSLVLHPVTKAVGFTGSFKGGMALYKLAQQRPEPIPVFAEMGSVNPVIVLPEVMAENAAGIAAKIADSITQSSGQFCTNPGLIFVIENPALQEFREALVNALKAKEPETMLHPSIWENYNQLRARVKAQPGVEILVESDTGGQPNTGQIQLSQVDAQHFMENHILEEEVFGPHSLLVVCPDNRTLKQVIQGMDAQLTASVFAKAHEFLGQKDLIFRLQQKVGRIILNGVPTGVEVSPSMHHGGPFPATTDSRFTAVGTDAVYRFLRAICYQNFPQEYFPKKANRE
jgi:alpha-ketoglutaric semialdehyde dehydrogenase